MMIDSENRNNLLQDYVLDLLPPAEKEGVTRQIGGDPALLAAVQRERQVGQLVKQTLQHAAAADNGRLVQLMPAIPARKRAFWSKWVSRQLGQQLAAVAMLLVLLLGGWQWFNGDNAPVWEAPPTILAVTATMTHTPAATETQMVPTETAVAIQPGPKTNRDTPFVRTPAPLPTPVAAVPINAN